MIEYTGDPYTSHICIIIQFLMNDVISYCLSEMLEDLLAQVKQLAGNTSIVGDE